MAWYRPAGVGGIGGRIGHDGLVGLTVHRRGESGAVRTGNDIVFLSWYPIWDYCNLWLYVRQDCAAPFIDCSEH
jgi:hypothetical protein